MLNALALLVIFILVVSEGSSIADRIEEEKVIADFKGMMRFADYFLQSKKQKCSL